MERRTKDREVEYYQNVKRRERKNSTKFTNIAHSFILARVGFTFINVCFTVFSSVASYASTHVIILHILRRRQKVSK